MTAQLHSPEVFNPWRISTGGVHLHRKRCLKYRVGRQSVPEFKQHVWKSFKAENRDNKKHGISDTKPNTTSHQHSERGIRIMSSLRETFPAFEAVKLIQRSDFDMSVIKSPTDCALHPQNLVFLLTYTVLQFQMACSTEARHGSRIV